MRRRRKYKRLTFKTREEWLQNRVIGGSSASAIVGKNPYKSKFDLYTDLTTKRKIGDSVQNQAMEYGHNLEPLIRKAFAYDHPQYIVKTPKNNEMYCRLDKPWMTATLDGQLIHKISKKKFILEIKTHDIRNKKDDEMSLNINNDIYRLLKVLNEIEDFKRLLIFTDYNNDSNKDEIRWKQDY